MCLHIKQLEVGINNLMIFCALICTQFISFIFDWLNHPEEKTFHVHGLRKKKSNTSLKAKPWVVIRQRHINERRLQNIINGISEKMPNEWCRKVFRFQVFMCSLFKTNYNFAFSLLNVQCIMQTHNNFN